MSLLQPKSIAVIGASAVKTKVGGQIMTRLSRFSGKVYPVNPQHKRLYGQRCYPSIISIPTPVDQAIIAIPAPLVPAAVADCIHKAVQSIVIISSGFSEAGAVGSQREEEIKAMIKPTRTKILGPNCFGYANPSLNLDLTFAKTTPPQGNIALISQSGAIGSYLFDWAQTEHLGFSKFISLGNRLGVGENDLLKILAQDKLTKVIALYLESFKNPSEFLAIASRVNRIKPIIVIFGGRSSVGRQAAQSHTAALSPPTALVDTLIKQSGSLQANSLEELTNLLEIFSLEPPLHDNDLAIVTNAGGPGILAADTAAAVKLDVSRPVDVFGDALARDFSAAFNQVIKDKVKDAFLIILSPQTMTQLEATCTAIVKQFSLVKKPIIVSLLGGEITAPAKEILRRQQIATIDFPQSAVRYLSRLYQYWHQHRHFYLYPRRFPVCRKKLISLPYGLLTWRQKVKLTKLFNLNLVKTCFAQENNLSAIINDLGYPLVLKSDPSELIHRTGNKAIYLNLNSFSAVKQRFKQLKQKLSLVLAQPQIGDGQEIFLGISREGNFPPLLTFGSGGIYAEVYRDIKQIFLPVNPSILTKLVKQTKIGQILSGYRGLPKINLQPLIKIVLNLQKLVLAYPSITKIDINPVIIRQNQAVIVDIKITVSTLTA